MKNIQTALFPLKIMLCLFGLEVFEYPQGRSRLYFTFIYILVICLLYVFNMIQIWVFLEDFKIGVYIFVRFTTILIVAYIVFNLYYNKVI